MLYFLLLFCGFATSIVQFILVREFMFVTTGNELAIGLLLSIWFLGIACGARLGAFSSRRIEPFPAFIAGVTGLTIVPWFSLVTARLMRAIFGILPGEYPSIVEVIGGLFLSAFPLTFILGFIFPFACRLSKGEKGRGIGWLYIWESTGGIIGGFLFTFVLVQYLNAVRLLGITGCSILIPLLLFLWGEKRFAFIFPALFLLIMHIFILRPEPSFRINELLVEKRWENLNPSIHLIDYDDSIYQNISVSGDEETMSLFLAGAYILSFPDDYEAKTLTNFIFSATGFPERVCIIGEKGLMLIKFIEELPIQKVDLIILDPSIKRLILPNVPSKEREYLLNAMDPEREGKVNVIFQDARRFLKGKKGEYDMVLSLSPDPDSILLNRLHTEEFFNEVKASLKDTGTFVTRVSSSLNYFRKESLFFNGSIYATIKKVFKHIAISPGREVFFFASDTEGVVSDHIEELTDRLKNRGIPPDLYDPAIFHIYLQPERVEFIKERLSSEEFRTNRDLKPLASIYSLITHEEQIGGGKPLYHITILMGIKPAILWAFSILCLTPPFIFYLSNKKRSGGTVSVPTPYHPFDQFHLLYPVFITGFGGMASELILLTAFQCYFGYIYREIGALVSSFMVGVLFGGIFIQRIRGNGRMEGERLLFNVMIAQSVFFLLLSTLTLTPAIFKAGVISKIALFLLVIIQGSFIGMVFPLSGSILYKTYGDEGKAGGSVDFADHAGAFTGSLCTQILLLTQLSGTGSFLLLFVMNVAGVIYLYLDIRWKKKGIDVIIPTE